MSLLFLLRPGTPATVALTFFLLTCIQPGSVAAAEGIVEEVIVSMPLHRSLDEHAEPVLRVADAALRRSVAATLGESLAALPGVSSANFGAGVGQPVIRGHTGPRVANLVNGLPAADASSVSPDHAVSIEPALAESVEILRGPATLLYGGGAIGGVVNVIDGRIPVHVPEHVEATAEVRHADVDDQTVMVGAANVGLGSSVFHLDWVDRRSNDLDIPGQAISAPPGAANSSGYLINSSQDYRARGAGFSQVFDGGYVGLAVSDTGNNYGIPPDSDAIASGEMVRIDLDQQRSELRAAWDFTAGPIETARLFAGRTAYEHREIEIADGIAEVGTRFESDTDHLRLELLHSGFDALRGAIGLQAAWRDFSVEGEEAYLPAVDHRSGAVFWVGSLDLAPYTLEAGLRVERNEFNVAVLPESDRDDTTVSYSVGFVRDIGSDWQLGLTTGIAERSAAMEELYSNLGNDNLAGTPGNDLVTHAATGVVERGDSTLDTELAHTVDAKLAFANERSELELNAFYNDFRRYIALLDSGESDIVEGNEILDYRAVGARFYGAEIAFNRDLAQIGSGSLQMSGFTDWVEARRSGGEQIPRLPPARVRLGLAWEGKAVYLGLGALHAFRQSAEPGEQKVAGYTKWDMDIEWRPENSNAYNWLLFLRARNLSDEKIRESTSFLRDVAPAAGRSIEFGFRLDVQ